MDDSKRLYVWKCPKCGYIVCNLEMQSLRIEPSCRCGKKFRYFVGGYWPVNHEGIENNDTGGGPVEVVGE